MGVRGESFLFWWSARNGEGLFGGPKPLRGFAHGARGPQVHSRYQLSHSIDDAAPAALLYRGSLLRRVSQLSLFSGGHPEDGSRPMIEACRIVTRLGDCAEAVQLATEISSTPLFVMQPMSNGEADVCAGGLEGFFVAMLCHLAEVERRIDADEPHCLDSSAIRDRLAAKRRLFPNSLGYVAAAHSFGAGYCATVRGEVPEACPRLARAITAVRARLLMRSIWLLTPSKLLFIDNSFTPLRIRP